MKNFLLFSKVKVEFNEKYKKALEGALSLLRESLRSSVYDDFENKIYIPVSYEIYKKWFKTNWLEKVKQFVKDELGIEDVVLINLVRLIIYLTSVYLINLKNLRYKRTIILFGNIIVYIFKYFRTIDKFLLNLRLYTPIIQYMLVASLPISFLQKQIFSLYSEGGV